jgi:hypothetical protein
VNITVAHVIAHEAGRLLLPDSNKSGWPRRTAEIFIQ